MAQAAAWTSTAVSCRPATAFQEFRTYDDVGIASSQAGPATAEAIEPAAASKPGSVLSQCPIWNALPTVGVRGSVLESLVFRGCGLCGFCGLRRGWGKWGNKEWGSGASYTYYRFPLSDRRGKWQKSVSENYHNCWGPFACRPKVRTRPQTEAQMCLEGDFLALRK